MHLYEIHWNFIERFNSKEKNFLLTMNEYREWTKIKIMKIEIKKKIIKVTVPFA